MSSVLSVITLDPLSEYEDPRLYVSLESGERALAEIGASLVAGRSPVLLAGPVGVGKTMLLSVLAERERASRVSVRFARSLSHSPEAIGIWLLRLLFGKSAPSAGEAELALLERLRALADKPVLLIVDDIHRAPIGSVRKLAALARGGAPALALVVCGTDGSDLRAATMTLAPESTVSLPEHLPDREIETLYDAILAHPGLSPRVLHRLETVPRADVLCAASGRPSFLKAELARREPRNPSRELPRPIAATTLVEVRTEPVQAPASPVIGRVAEKQPRRAAQRIHSAASRVKQPFVRAGRAAAAIGAALLGLLRSARAALARSARAAGAVGAALFGLLRSARAALARSARAAAAIGAALLGLLRSARDVLARSVRAAAAIGAALLGLLRSARDGLAQLANGSWESIEGAFRSARRFTANGHVRLIGARARIRFAARARADSLSTGLDAAARTAALLVRQRRERAIGRARHARAALLAQAQAHATRASTGLRATTRGATRRCAATAARARQKALRAVPASAAPATALVALAVFSLSGFEPDFGSQSRPLTAVADVADVSAAASPVSVQVNARPWALVRIGGIDLGATPLSHRLAPGVYQLEAKFPDGRRIEKKIDVRPESRFVILP